MNLAILTPFYLTNLTLGVESCLIRENFGDAGAVPYLGESEPVTDDPKSHLATVYNLFVVMARATWYTMSHRLGMLTIVILVLIVNLVLWMDTSKLEYMYSKLMVSARSKGPRGVIPPPPQTIPIPINPNATMAYDIVSIDHNVSESAILVRFKSGARCSRPYLRGRLSGPALTMLNWSIERNDRSINATNETTILKGTYQAPLHGKYYLEIIMVFCVDFLQANDGMMNITSNNYNFSQTCVEDRWNHRLTAHNASILVGEEAFGSPGYWVREDSKQMQPMYTRFQPNGCRPKPPEPDLPDYCIPPTSLDRFEGYSFHWHRPNLTLANLRQAKPTTICLVGDSHSQKLDFAAKAMGINQAAFNLGLRYQKGLFPTDITVEKIKSLTKYFGCNKFIIASGQWPASAFARPKVFLIGNYYNQIKNMLQELQTLPHVEIFMRSINYNPLGDWIGDCPPRDWRNPLVIDGYNAAIAKACQEIGGPNVTFVDTNFLVSPMWDSSSDFCHLDEKSLHAQVLYVAAVALGVVDPTTSSVSHSRGL